MAPPLQPPVPPLPNPCPHSPVMSLLLCSLLQPNILTQRANPSDNTVERSPSLPSSPPPLSLPRFSSILNFSDYSLKHFLTLSADLFGIFDGSATRLPPAPTPSCALPFKLYLPPSFNPSGALTPPLAIIPFFNNLCCVCIIMKFYPFISP